MIRVFRERKGYEVEQYESRTKNVSILCINKIISCKRCSLRIERRVFQANRVLSGEIGFLKGNLFTPIHLACFRRQPLHTSQSNDNQFPQEPVNSNLFTLKYQHLNQESLSLPPVKYVCLKSIQKC